MELTTSISSRFILPLALFFIVTFGAGTNGFDDLVLTQSAPIGMVRDPLNSCIYVIFYREVRLVCDNGTGSGSCIFFVTKISRPGRTEY
jgi:hypothetical protein